MNELRRIIFKTLYHGQTDRFLERIKSNLKKDDYEIMTNQLFKAIEQYVIKMAEVSASKAVDMTEKVMQKKCEQYVIKETSEIRFKYKTALRRIAELKKGLDI